MRSIPDLGDLLPVSWALRCDGGPRRLSALGHDELTDRALRAEQLELIAARVSFDAHVFAMTDPSTGIVTSPHATVPMVPESDLPGLIRRRYAARSVTEWRAALAEFGITDVVSVTFEDRWGAWGFLDLWRCGATFSDGERDQLAALAPAMTPPLRMTVSPRSRFPTLGPRGSSPGSSCSTATSGSTR